MSAACWDLDRLQARYGALWDITEGAGAFTAVPRDGGDTYAANSVLVLRCLLSDAVVGLAFAAVSRG
jgi:hypothetical protein